MRQELDLRLLAREKGYRVVGVASDLNVSATKVPPWKRKGLGEWLNDRVPEFDALLFWKLDRFIRNLSDLSVMVQWAERYGKNLVSKSDPIDLGTSIGKVLVTVIGGIAEIEAGNTSTRVTSLWEYNKTQSAWLVGKPAYGYRTAQGDNGRTILVVDPGAEKALRWAQRMALRGVSARRMATCLRRSGLMREGLTTSTLLRRLRNPALLGYRTEEHKNGGVRRSRFALDRDGKPIRVAPEIFTQEEFDAKSRDGSGSWPFGASAQRRPAGHEVMGFDVGAAWTKPFDSMRFAPGPALGSTTTGGLRRPGARRHQARRRPGKGRTGMCPEPMAGARRC